jgi:hypothetical protein
MTTWPNPPLRPDPAEVAFRVFFDGKYTCVIYAADGETAILKAGQRLDPLKLPVTEIKAYRANSASD